jgi:crotonobetainyl-CoA:carnitine CoA-transferase CaiB-like acyl-CoA transferase
MALKGITVIELCCTIAGAYCCKLLAGFGARVLMIESPDNGSSIRQQGPYIGKEKGNQHSVYHLWLNTNKESVTIDLKTQEGIDCFHELLRNADVFVHDYPQKIREISGINFNKIHNELPELISTSITPYGESGPYQHFSAEEIQLQAMSGLMHLTGDPEKEPLASGPSICHYTSAFHAYTATLLALFDKFKTGIGQKVEVSMHESNLENIEIALTKYLHSSIISKRGPHAGVPWRTYRCRDGFVVIISMPARHWYRANEFFCCRELFEEKYQHISGRIADRKKYESLLEDCLETIDRHSLFEWGQARNLAFGYVASLSDALKSPQLLERNFFCHLHDPTGEENIYTNSPFILKRTPWQTIRAPLLGENNCKFYEKRTPTKPITNLLSTNSHLPLHGLRVIDMSHSWAAPHTARILADFGAEVIKVEYPKRLCLLRGARKDDRRFDTHPAWHQVNRNKRSITLDLKVERDKKILASLLSQSDILIENSRPGVLKTLGFSYEDVIKLRQDIIMLSMSAFGATGPRAAYCGYGAVFEALSGIQSLTAYGKGQPPQRIKELDVTNGIAGAAAILTALVHRFSSGEGQHIDLSQLETSTHALIGEHLLYLAAEGKQSLPNGNRHQFFAPQGCYPCRGVDKWITITIRSDEEWYRFCQILGKPKHLMDQRYSSRELRKQYQDDLDQHIGECTCNREHIELMFDLQQQGIAAGAVLTSQDIANDPHLLSRQYFKYLYGDTEKRFMGFPFVLHNNPKHIERQGPNLGQDNEFVLCQQLGLPKKILADLAELKIGTAFDHN